MTSLFPFWSCFALLCQELCVHLTRVCRSRYDEVTEHRGTSASQGIVCVLWCGESTLSFPAQALQREEPCPYFLRLVDLDTPLPCEAFTVFYSPIQVSPRAPCSRGCGSVLHLPPLVPPEVTPADLSAVVAKAQPVFLGMGFYSFCHTSGRLF